jgi:hypothetical protein
MFRVALATRKKKVIYGNARTAVGDLSPSKKMNEYRKPGRNRRLPDPWY